MSILVGASIAFIANIATLVSVSTIVAGYSLWFLMIAVVDAILSYMVIIRQNKLDYSFNHDNTRVNRKESYYKNICFSSGVQMEDRIFGVIDDVKLKYQQTASEILNIQKEYLKKYHTFGFVQETASNALVMGAMIISTLLISIGRLTIGEFVSSLTGVRSLSGQLLSLIIQFPKLIQNSRYADDYKKIVDYRPHIEDNGLDRIGEKLTFKSNGKTHDVHPGGRDDEVMPAERTIKNHTIEFRRVSFKYPTSERWVLKDISFVVDSGKKYAIVGENGAGKTTIIKLILRLYDPTEGEILLDGKNLRTIPVRTLREQFTSIFQNYNLYSIPLQENIWFRSSGDTGKLLHKVGLDRRFGSGDWSRTVTKQFDDDGIVLSGGEAQRLCIARALGKDAPIVLLDEPSSALDPKIEDEVIKLLLEETREKTTIIITHRLSMCTATDEILYLENGGIAEQGTHAELLKNHGKYYDLFMIQAKNYSV